MNTSELLVEVRDLVADCDGTTKEAQILRAADRHIRSLARRMIEHKLGYFTTEINFEPGDFVQVYQGVWETQLPPWTSRIMLVQMRSVGGEEVRLEPYESTKRESLSSTLRVARQADRRGGWEFSGTDLFRVHGASEGQLKLKLQVAKMPAPLCRVTLTDEQPGDSSHFLMPLVPDVGRIDTTQNIYMNTRFQVQGVTPPVSGERPRPIMGEQRIGISSEANFIKEGFARTRVGLQKNFTVPLKPGDLLETVVEIPDEHSRLLVLMIAENTFQRRNNTDAIRSIKDEFSQEWDAFMGYINPRQSQTPSIARKSLQRPIGSMESDPDRDYRNTRYW